MTKPKLSLPISLLLILTTFLLTLGFALTARAADTYQSTSYTNQNTNNSYFRYRAAISGAQEIPAVNSGVTGHMSIDFYASGEGILYWVSGVGQGITEVHLHCALPNANGPVVAVLHRNQSGQNFNEQQMASGTIINGGFASTGAECVNTIGYGIANVSDLSRAIREGKIYVNIHNLQFPNGAARGQLTSSEVNNYSSVYYPVTTQPNPLPNPIPNPQPTPQPIPQPYTPPVYYPIPSSVTFSGTGVSFPGNRGYSSVTFPPPNTTSGTYVGVHNTTNPQPYYPAPTTYYPPTYPTTTPPVTYNPPVNPYYPNYCIQGQSHAYNNYQDSPTPERKNFFSRMFSFKG